MASQSVALTIKVVAPPTAASDNPDMYRCVDPGGPHEAAPWIGR